MVDGKDIAADIGDTVQPWHEDDEFKNVKVLELNGCIQSSFGQKTNIQDGRPQRYRLR